MLMWSIGIRIPIHRYVINSLRTGSCQPYANKLSITSTNRAYMSKYSTAVWRWQPTTIHLHGDYDQLAIHNAVAAVWPSTTRRGCNFHYKKALLKHVKQTNIWEEYLTPNSPVWEFFAMTGAIDYLPETDVDRIWRHLKPNLPIDMAEFASYY